MSWIAAGGSVLSSGLGMMSSRKASKDEKKAQQVALSNAGQAYTPIQVMGPGGAGVTFGGTGVGAGGGGMLPDGRGGYVQVGPPSSGGQFPTQGEPIPGTPYFSDGYGGQIDENGLQVVAGTRGRVRRSNITNAQIGVGDLDPLRSGLVGQATMLGGNMGMDPSTMALLANYQQAGNVFGDAGLSALSQLQNNAMLGAGMSAAQLGDASDFADALRTQAQGAFAAIPGTQEEARAESLRLMREQAAPFEERAFAGMQDKQFATGQMGTTGGGLQTEAFARGLGQADLQRQLSAMAEGRAAQQAQLGLGTGLAGQQDMTLGNAMNRFGQMTGLAQSLGQDRFARTSNLANTNFARAGQMLGLSPQMLQQQILGGQLGNMGAMLQNIGGINQTGYNAANFAQMLMANQAAARGGQAMMANQMAQPDFSQANMWGQLGGSLMGLAAQGGIPNPFSGMFGGGGGGGSSAGAAYGTGVGAGTSAFNTNPGNVSSSFLNT